MNRKLYLECMSGISGDMTVAALLDLGADEKVLLEVLASIPAEGYAIQISRVKKAGLDVCDFDVILDAEHENHDHDMAYLHGGEAIGHTEPCAYDHEEMHHHEHNHEDEHHHEQSQEETHHHEHMHAHAHRGMNEVLAIISQTKMTEHARELAVRILDVLAGAESKAHGVPKEEVHFHEVGAIDSIIDIVAVAVCIDNLSISEVIVPVLYEGTGTIRCQHGILPIPVPAVSNILCDYGIRLHRIEEEGEFVTPTGAAIVAALRTSDQLPDEYTICGIGLGAGKREYKRPGILRAMLIEEQDNDQGFIYKLESNVDDCSGEALGYVLERLLEAGARDVHYTPVYMKKNRPAYQLNVLCDEQDIKKLEQIMFKETTTIGIRRVKMERTMLARVGKTIHTTLGDAEVKLCKIKGEEDRIYPEYESVRALSLKHGISYREVYRLIIQEYHV